MSGFRPTRLLERPWFWALLIGLSVAGVMLKVFMREMPAPLPVLSAPLELSLPDEQGRTLALSELRGRLAIVTELPLANAPECDLAFDGLYRLRKRLKGLADAVQFVALCHGGAPADLSALLDARVARKPFNHFLLDPAREEMAWLRETAGAPSAAFLLLDRHGRLRALAGDTEEEIDKLVVATGQLANWPQSDLPP